MFAKVVVHVFHSLSLDAGACYACVACLNQVLVLHCIGLPVCHYQAFVTHHFPALLPAPSIYAQKTRPPPSSWQTGMHVTMIASLHLAVQNPETPLSLRLIVFDWTLGYLIQAIHAILLWSTPLCQLLLPLA